MLSGAAHSSENTDAIRSQDTPALGNGMVPDVVENDIVMLITPSEVLLRVVNHVIRAHRAGLLHVPCAADGGDLCAKRLCDLDREGTHASGGAVDQHLLSRANVSLVAKTLQSGEPRDSDRTGLLERDVSWLHDQCPFGGTCIFGDRSVSDAENFIARFKLSDVLTHGFDRARAIDPKARVLWLTHSAKRTHREGAAE